MRTKARGRPKDFPLFLHATGQWAKKIRGRMYYFGKDRDAAARKWADEKDDLIAGRTPKNRDGLTVADLCNRFLTSKKSLLNAGELSPRTWKDYYATCETLIDAFGRGEQVGDLEGTHFERLRARLAKTRGPVALGNEIQRVRTVFGYAFHESLIDRPIRFGAAFKKPSRKVIRKARNDRGSRMVTTRDLHKLLAAADAPMRAFILLALNCGYGQSDCAELPRTALDLEHSWVRFPRPKTQIVRRCPLWPETVAAIKAAVAARPKPKSQADDRLAFLTETGRPWVRMKPKADPDKPGVFIDAIGVQWGKLIKAAGVPRCTFYDLRHVHRTVGDQMKDQPAADYIMGHVPSGMASAYREEIGDDRLKAITDAIHEWLWPTATQGEAR